MHILLLWDHTCPSYYFSATVVLRNTEIDAAIQSTLLSAITIQDLGSKWSCTPQITHGPIRNEPHKKSGAVWYERVRITFGCMMEVTWLVWTMWRAVWTFSNFLSLCSTEETDTQTFVDLGKQSAGTTQPNLRSTETTHASYVSDIVFECLICPSEKRLAVDLLCVKSWLRSPGVYQISANHQKIHILCLHPLHSMCPLISLWHHHHHRK